MIKAALLALLLVACDKGPEFTYGQHVCVTGGFYAGLSGTVKAEGSDMFGVRTRRYLVRFDIEFKPLAEFIPAEYLDACPASPDPRPRAP